MKGASGAALDHLNPEQRLAVEHGVKGPGNTIAGPVLVSAGAGSGKTAVLACRVAHLIANGVDPSRICAITFTRKAADQIKSRVMSTLAALPEGAGKGGGVDLPWAGTFHAVGTKLIRIYASRLGLKAGFTTLDRDDSAGLMEIVRQDLGLAERDLEFPKKETCLSIYSRTVNSQEPLRDVLGRHFPWCQKHRKNLRKLFAGYVNKKLDQCVLDFDDLLLHWLDLLQHTKTAREIRARFDHILVDEFQDTNRLQGAILRLMRPDGTGVFVVGDAAQAIYSFRAAEVRNILDFPAGFTPPARVIKLERNYRSTKLILDAANAVINLSSDGLNKNLTATRKGKSKPRLMTVLDGAAEATVIADELEGRVEQGRSLTDIAILIRASRHSSHLELELARRGLAFKKFGGTKFTEAAHVKDMIAVLRWAENPMDMIAGLRVLNLLPGIGPKIARGIIDAVVADDFIVGLKGISPPKQAHDYWRPFVQLMRRVHGEKLGWPGEVEAVRNWLTPMLPGLYGEPIERAKDLEQLQAMAGTFKSRRKFLSDLTLEPPARDARFGLARKGEEQDFITISTIHSAKGLEWRSVYVLNVVDGGLPSSRCEDDAQIEEERRLLYVAMTRAERELTLMVPLNQTRFGPGANGGGSALIDRSRFVPDEILGKFDVVAWEDRVDGELDEIDDDHPTLDDIAARIRSRWA